MAEPQRIGGLERGAAIAEPGREAAFRAEDLRAGRRMDAVGADQQVDPVTRSVGQGDGDAVGLRDDIRDDGPEADVGAGPRRLGLSPSAWRRQNATG